LAQIDTKAMLDDVRGRDTAWLTLLLATDRQAMDLFRIYVTLDTAIASAMAAGIHNGLFGITSTAMLALTPIAVCLLVGCYYCLQALNPIAVTLPGRASEFWQWARRADVDENRAVDAYLEYAEKAQVMAEKVNLKNSTDLHTAKKCGIVGVVAAVLFAVVAWQAP
jgi:hypothetical protein